MSESVSLTSTRDNMAYAGVDLHKSYCLAIVCTENGEVLKEGRIRTEKEELGAFFAGFRNLEVR
jgi:predicted NBD/HSP70 family sugar kinase